jgi:signal transduction histidine kinase
VIVAVNLVIFFLPLLALGFLRIYDDQLIRQTEAELLAQGAFVVGTFRTRLLERLGQEATSYGNEVAPEFRGLYQGEIPRTVSEARLGLGSGPIRGRAEQAQMATAAPHPAAAEVGDSLGPLLQEASRITLAGIRLVDPRGVVVASSRGEVGLSLAHREEVSKALLGEPVSLLRVRISDEPAPPLSSLSRETGVRAFVAIPVVAAGRVLGAAVLSRTPMSLGKAYYQDRYNLLATAGVMICVVLAVSLLTSATIVRPVQALIAQSERIAEGSERTAAPISKPGTQEIAQLSESVASMASSLQRRADYIRAFASNVSHEFKTPLTAIRGAVELLRDHAAEMPEEQRRKFLDNLGADAERMDRLVKRLLELARADVLRPGNDRSDPRAVIERLVEAQRKQGRAVVASHGEGIGSVRMAGEILEDILSNLVENAHIHGGDGVRVQIETRALPGDGRVQLTVSDDGAGISAGNASRIFEAFFTTARERGGTGLGLTIIRTLIDAHGGSIALAPSERGASFRVVIPS